MAEEFLQGGVCGGSWWNSPRNLFSSSPCSLASSDAGSFGWASNELIMEMKSATPSDDSASDRSSSAPPRADGIAFSSPAGGAHHHWNNHHHHHQDLLRDSGRLEENYSTFLQDSSMNYRPQTNKNFSEDSYASSLLQTLLFDTDSQPQQPFSHNQTSMNYSSSAANPYDQQMNSNGFLLSQPKPSPSWNSTAAASNNVPSTFLPSTQSQFIPSSLSSNQKSDIHSISSAKEADKELATVVKRVSREPPFKRSRIETPSPLPTFKVRKEKLGDRITALQQLVSPFGKTDTASVLHEAIEYIRFLHDQVDALSTPYLKHGSSQRQQGADKPKDQQLLTMDLKTRGLCLVPVSSTFPVASETATDFWTPTFSGSFRQR